MIGDSVAITILCLVTDGLDSLGYPYFYIVVLGTSIRFGLAESCVNAIVSTVLTVLLYQVAASALGLVDLAARVFYLFFIALLGGLLSREEKRQKGNAVAERDRSELLLSVNRAINSTLDLPEMLQRIIDEGLRAIDCRGGCLVLLDGFGGKAERVAVAGSFTMSAAKQISASWAKGDLPDLKQGSWHVLNGMHEIQTVLGAEIAETVASESLAVLTLRRRHELGFLALADPARGDFTDERLVLLSALADQAAVAIENGCLLEDGLRERDRKQRILTRLIHSEEEERKRVAGEIHDSLGKRLFELHYGLRQCEEQLSDRDPLVAQILRRLDDEARGCADEIRAITNQLRPAVIDDFGFVAALKEYVETLKAQGDFAFVDLGIDCDVPIADRDANVMLFRVLHEAVLNTRKHAVARHLWISLVNGDAGKLVLKVRDDGAGFDPNAVPRGHFGLLYMRERVEACNGAFVIASVPGKGTEVSVLLPAERIQP
jgi:signal transduction histidine kinase